MSHSDYRINNYSIIAFKERTIVMNFATITFKRRYYRNKSTGKYYFYVDDMLSLLPRQRVSHKVCADILSQLATGRSTYAQAASRYGLSKNFTYNLLKSISSDTDIPDKPKDISCDYIYFQVDEEHIHLQHKGKKALRKKDGSKIPNCYELKEVTVFTGREWQNSNRYQLQNKTHFVPFKDESNEDFTNRIYEYIQRNYTVISKQDSYLYGDGASYIKTMADQLGCVFILDRFHFQQALTRLTGGRKHKDVRQLLNYYATTNQKNEFEYLGRLHMGLEQRLGDFYQKQLSYLINNWEFYQHNFTLPNQTGSSAEGMNSHYYASYFSSRPKGFLKTNIHKTGTLISLKESQIDIAEYYLNHLYEMNYKVKSYYQSETYHHKIKKVTSYEQYNNIPVMNHHATAGIRKAMRMIAYG
ncbi:MAG: UPF0236 family protein [Longicatena sp.]